MRFLCPANQDVSQTILDYGHLQVRSVRINAKQVAGSLGLLNIFAAIAQFIQNIRKFYAMRNSHGGFSCEITQISPTIRGQLPSRPNPNVTQYYVLYEVSISLMFQHAKVALR